jgi:uncharacterized protein YndB with AHSA1/START domain
MTALAFALERRITIRAEIQIVFRFFTDSILFADWWGAGSEIHPEVGGTVKVRYPNGITVLGEILEIKRNQKIVFTYGYESGTPIAPGASRVTITLSEHSEGTELHLRHEFADASVRDAHVAGWKHQLALFANAATREQNKNLQARVEEYFESWNIKDANERLQKLSSAVTQGVEFHDAYGCTLGIDELNGYITAIHQYFPMKLQSDGPARECQGNAFCHWKAEKADGSSASRGLIFFDLAPDGRIKRIVGFWLPAQSSSNDRHQ